MYKVQFFIATKKTKKENVFMFMLRLLGIQAQAKGQKACLGSMMTGNPKSGSGVCKSAIVLI